MLNPQEIRRELHEQHREAFAAVPIRLISKIDQEARAHFTTAGEEYDGYTGAIGDINLMSFPEALRGDLYVDRRDELLAEGERLVKAEKPLFTCYDYNGTGFICLKQLWRECYLPFSAATAEFNPYVFYGGTHAFSMTAKAMHRLLGRRVSVFMPVPTFPPFFFQLEQFFDLNCIPTHFENQFKLQLDDVEKTAREELEIVYLTVVSNPTGLAYTPTELETLLTVIIKKNADAILLLDAVYLRTLPVDEARALWEVMVSPGIKNNAVIFDSLSKTYGRTGLRSGVVFMHHEKLEQSLIDLMQNEIAGISYATQIESAGILSLVKEDAVSAMAGEIAGRRQRFLENYLEKYAEYVVPLAKQPLIPANYWQGGLYAFLQLRENIGAIDFFIETGVACISGFAFMNGDYRANRFIRVSFGMEDI